MEEAPGLFPSSAHHHLYPVPAIEQKADKVLDVGRREGAERLLVVGAEVDVAEIIGIDGIKPIAVFLELLGMAFQHIVHAFREVRSVGTLFRDTAKLLIDDAAHILPFCRIGIKRNQERRLSRRESADRRAGGNTIAGALGLADGLGIKPNQALG